mgnify:CR=1 FL=1
MKNKIILVAGDPNSINSEIIVKSWKKLANSTKKKVFLISNFRLFKMQLKKLNYSLKILKVKDFNQTTSVNYLKIIDIKLDFKDPFNVPKSSASKYILNSLNLAHKLALDKNVSGIINCAINKQLLNKNKIGVTEFLADKCRVKDNSEVMLIHNKKLSVCPITTHIDIKQVTKQIKSSIISKKVKTINEWYKKTFDLTPKFGMLGLNPHNAEYRKNSEEKKILIPTVKKLKKLKININGPLISDTAFINDHKNYDVLLGMYHDQVLSPFKTLFKYDAINITLGLKYLRLSPDHGTAMSLIGKNKANPESLIKNFNFIEKLKK